MKIRTIRIGSLLVGLVTACVVTAICLIFTTRPLDLIAVFAIIFIVSNSITAYVLQKFMVYRLKPMYQFMLSKNVPTDNLGKTRTGSTRLAGQIEEDLRDWAEKSRQEIERLKENEKYRKEYIGNVSHEIKTPIFNIQGYISTLLDGGLHDEEINRKYLERAEKSIDRLINIVTDLDEISKLESGRLVLHKERFDLLAVVRETIDSVEMEAARKNIRVVVAEKQSSLYEPLTVRADKHYVSQILINLLTNSIRYGNINGLTTITFHDLFDKIMVEVTDNGVGISQQDIPRVFERFYRTDKSRSREEGGTGLGLSIVKHIVEAHGETINLHSILGEGSTFSFTLSKN